MSAVLLAVFNDFEAAEQVRTDLVRDGFPTDRIELTATCEPGRAGCQPAQSVHDKLYQHFRTLFCNKDEQPYVEQLVEQIEHGAAAVTVLPRGAIEAERAKEILHRCEPAQLAEHDLNNHGMEHAASKHEGAWMRNLWLEPGDYHCIYCRMMGSRQH